MGLLSLARVKKIVYRVGKHYLSRKKKRIYIYIYYIYIYIYIIYIYIYIYIYPGVAVRKKRAESLQVQEMTNNYWFP